MATKSKKKTTKKSTRAPKMVYYFGKTKTDGNATQRELRGGEFLQPHGCVAVRSHLFVSEQAGKRIQAFTRSGEFVGMLAPPRCGDLGAMSAAEHAEGATLFVTDLDQRCARILELEPW